MKRVTQGIFLWNYFKIWLAVSEKKIFLGISSCLYSARTPHSPEQCFLTDQNFRNTFRSPKEHSCEIISKSDQRFQKRRLHKKTPFHCHGNQSFWWNQILWTILKRTSQGTFLTSLVQIGPAVWDEKMFKEIVDDAWLTHHHPKSSPWARCAKVS